jgi:hypothetical protein
MRLPLDGATNAGIARLLHENMILTRRVALLAAERERDIALGVMRRLQQLTELAQR